MNRREFFQRTFGAAAVAVVAPFLPKPKPQFKRDAFQSIRFVKCFDVQTASQIHRLDILYGFGTLRPDLACRVAE